MSDDDKIRMDEWTSEELQKHTFRMVHKIDKRLEDVVDKYHEQDKKIDRLQTKSKVWASIMAALTGIASYFSGKTF